MAVVFTDLNVQGNHCTARRSATPEPPIHVHKYRLLGPGLLHQATSVLR